MAAALGLPAAVVRGVGIVGREELVDGELDMAEHLAGVLVVAAAGALLLRHAVVVHRHEELGIPLQTDDGELAQSDVDALAVAAEAQVAAEAGADAGGHVGQGAVAGMALAHVYQLHVENDGIHHLHHGGGKIGLAQALFIQTVHRQLGGEHLGAALAAEENDPLVKNAQTADLHRPGGAHKGIGSDLVEVAHIHGVETTVETHRLNIDVNIQQLGAAGLDAHGPLNGGLGALGGVEAKILDTILIGRYSVLYTPQDPWGARVCAQKGFRANLS